jgi:hypothetical protein
VLSYDDYVREITKLPRDRQDELLGLLEELSGLRRKKDARHFFLPFVKTMWPGFVEGTHHKIIADLFDEVVQGKKNRVIINMPPRHTKSEFASVHLPAFYLGRYPDRLVIQASPAAACGPPPSACASAEGRVLDRWLRRSAGRSGGQFARRAAGDRLQAPNPMMTTDDQPPSRLNRFLRSKLGLTHYRRERITYFMRCVVDKEFLGIEGMLHTVKQTVESNPEFTHFINWINNVQSFMEVICADGVCLTYLRQYWVNQCS